MAAERRAVAWSYDELYSVVSEIADARVAPLEAEVTRLRRELTCMGLFLDTLDGKFHTHDRWIQGQKDQEASSELERRERETELLHTIRSELRLNLARGPSHQH